MGPKTHLSNETTSAKGRRVASAATIRNPTAREPTRGGMGAGQNEGNMSWVFFWGFGFIPKCFMIHAFCFGRRSIFDFESC